MNKTVAFIPVRGGSKSIPLKNIKLMAGKPLVQWTIEAALQCNQIERVYVSTDSHEIREVIENMNFDKVSVIFRSKETATDTAPSESALIEFAMNYDFENIVFIQATSPMLTGDDLDHGLEKFYTEQYDSLISVVRQKRFIWQEEGNTVVPVNYDFMRRPRRQDFQGYLVENGAFYITKKDLLLKNKCRISGQIGCYEMPEETYYEIDELADWTIVESLLSRRSENSPLDRKLSKVQMLITDCDGVLTDGGMYYSERGDELKKFNTKDGMGLKLLQDNGIITAIITGEDVQIVRNRAKKMQVNEVFCGIKNKKVTLEKLLEKYNLSHDQVAYIGDDLNDLEIMQSVGVSFSVPDGMESVKKIADYVTTRKGGDGAVREVADLILASKRNS